MSPGRHIAAPDRRPLEGDTCDPDVRAPGPPPPPARAGGEGESRATAAAWVAGVGAALLLAAAGTFLAVSWDTLELTARVAVVASVTGAAILGGHQLRRVLPAVGTVVFHLGALLLPVDALGLAYQLQASVAARWSVVGLTAVLALPVLAVVGRSRILGLAGLSGVPVLATGLGITGLAPPSLVLVVLAMAALGVETTVRPGASDGPLAPVRSIAAPGLAFTAVAVPLVTALAARVTVTGTVLGSAAAGWVATSWVVPASVGVMAVGVLAATATRRHDSGVAGLAIAAGVFATIVTVLPPATPRTVLLLAPSVVWLLAEVGALGGRDHPLWGSPTRTTTRVLEGVALLAVLGAVTTLMVGPGADVGPDPAVAARSLTLAAAWLLAAARHAGPRDGGSGRFAVAALGTVVLHLAAASQQLGLAPEITGAVLVTGAGASLGVLTAGSSPAHTALTRPAARQAAPLVAACLLALATAVMVDRSGVGILVVAVPAILGTHSSAALRSGARSAGLTVTFVLGASVALLAWLGVALEATGQLPWGAGLLAAVGGVLWLAVTVERLEPAADSLRALAVVAGLLLVVPAWGGTAIAAGGDATALWWTLVLQVVPGAVVPATAVATWLVVDAVRCRRIAVATLAAPVIVRAVAAGLLAGGATLRVTGGVLLVVAVVAACAAALGPRGVLAASATIAAVAGSVGWVLIGEAPTLRAALVVAGGLAVAGVGSVRRQPVVAHLGGVIATVGTWQLLGLGEVTALDVWLLPVALQLAVAGELMRRRGSSSWVSFVPPLLLVALPALAERIGGGPGWHAVLAGGLGVVATVIGGARRLGGPLIVGTAVVVVVVLVETFAVVAAVPTWMWLACGGFVLLGAAALIERIGGSPVRAVRRAVDVVTERFD